MLLAMSSWMRFVFGNTEDGAAPARTPPSPDTLSPAQEELRRAVTEAVTAHPLHRELVDVHQLGGCQYFAFAGAMALNALGCGRAEVALGRVAFRTRQSRWIGYPATRREVRVPDPAEQRDEAEAFQFHAWIRLTEADGRRCAVDFDLTNVLREAALRAGPDRVEFARAPAAFWGTDTEARRAGLRFEAMSHMTADTLMAGDRKVFQAIADEVLGRLQG